MISHPGAFTLRAAVVLGPLLAIACTRAAGDQPVLALEIVVIGLAFLCAVYPDTHLGLLLVLIVGINWLVAVDDIATPWSIGVAVSLALFHTLMAAASVAPFRASWTRAMRQRWIRRFGVLAAATGPVWTLTVFLQRTEVPSSQLLVAAALLALAAGAVWAGRGGFTNAPAAKR